MTFSLEKGILQRGNYILGRFKLKCLDGLVSYRRATLLSTSGEVWIIVMFLSAVFHSDGTHSLQRIF